MGPQMGARARRAGWQRRHALANNARIIGAALCALLASRLTLGHMILIPSNEHQDAGSQSNEENNSGNQNNQQQHQKQQLTLEEHLAAGTLLEQAMRQQQQHATSNPALTHNHNENQQQQQQQQQPGRSNFFETTEASELHTGPELASIAQQGAGNEHQQPPQFAQAMPSQAADSQQQQAAASNLNRGPNELRQTQSATNPATAPIGPMQPTQQQQSKASAQQQPEVQHSSQVGQQQQQQQQQQQSQQKQQQTNQRQAQSQQQSNYQTQQQQQQQQPIQQTTLRQLVQQQLQNRNALAQNYQKQAAGSQQQQQQAANSQQWNSVLVNQNGELVSRQLNFADSQSNSNNQAMQQNSAAPPPPPPPPMPSVPLPPAPLENTFRYQYPPLYYGHNPFIERLRPQSYADDNIVTLNLSHSHIYEIDNDAFVGQRFEHIDLSNNKLGLIHSRSFRIGPNHSKHNTFDPRASHAHNSSHHAQQKPMMGTRRPPPAHPKSVTIDFSHNPAIVALSGAFDHIDVPNCVLNFTNSTVELKFGAFKKYFKEHPGHIIDIESVDCCDQEWLLGYKHNFVEKTRCAHDPNLYLLKNSQQTIIDSCIAYVTSARHSMTMPGSGIIHSLAANMPRNHSNSHNDNQYLTYLILGGTAMILTSLSIYIIFYMFSLKAAFVYQTQLSQTQKN